MKDQEEHKENSTATPSNHIQRESASSSTIKVAPSPADTPYMAGVRKKHTPGHFTFNALHTNDQPNKTYDSLDPNTYPKSAITLPNPDQLQRIIRFKQGLRNRCGSVFLQYRGPSDEVLSESPSPSPSPVSQEKIEEYKEHSPSNAVPTPVSANRTLLLDPLTLNNPDSAKRAAIITPPLSHQKMRAIVRTQVTFSSAEELRKIQKQDMTIIAYHKADFKQLIGILKNTPSSTAKIRPGFEQKKYGFVAKIKREPDSLRKLFSPAYR